MGFPTANVSIPKNTCLDDGVYYGWSSICNPDNTPSAIYPSLISYSNNPTFDSAERVLEIHILNDFSNEFYGQVLKTFIYDLIRRPIKFASIDDLRKQIEKDKAYAESLFAHGVPDKVKSKMLAATPMQQSFCEQLH